MSVVGKLCHHFTASSRVLVYKSGGVHLVYKAKCGEETTVTFAWGADGNDLDICAYWLDAPNTKVGFGYNYHAAGTYQEYSAKVNNIDYVIGYNGDVRDTNNSELIKVKKSRWSSGSNTLRIHLNFYGYDASQYPATTCTVIAAQTNGPTIACAATTNAASGRARVSDPYVDVVFSATGILQSVTYHTA